MNLGDLRFSASAWAKLCYMRDKGNTEISGFGISHPDDPMLVEKFVLVKQKCSSVTTEFEDKDVADFTDDMVDEGYNPNQFMRIWIHTHPGNSASPSGTDEKTFDRVFGHCNWSVMAILACGGDTYCRIRFTEPVKAEFETGMSVDWDYEFDAVKHEEWDKEYKDKVSKETFSQYQWTTNNLGSKVWQQSPNKIAGTNVVVSNQNTLPMKPIEDDDKPAFLNYLDEEEAAYDRWSWDNQSVQNILDEPDDDDITPNEAILLEENFGNKNFALARIRNKFRRNRKV